MKSGASETLVWKRPFAWAAIGALLVLAGTAEERLFGLVTDEAQVVNTAVSIAMLGEIGIGRGERFLVPRPQGDAVTPYGIGLAFVEVPAVLLAPAWEARFGAGSSQTVFVATMVLLVWVAALGAGLLARRLGATAGGAAFAVLACALASPLSGYTGQGYSEPLQALCLVWATLLSAAAARGGRSLGALGAGFCAGYAVLAKSVNLAVAPFALLPLSLDGSLPRRERARRMLLAAAGAAVPLGAWLALEVVRFGTPLSSYAEQRFNHPLLDGLWRLLVGPNEGLVFYMPLLPFAVAGVVALAFRRDSRGSALAVAGISGALLVISASWFAWDGAGGWGPRFLMPAVPLLCAAVGAWLPRAGALRGAALALLLGGTLVNTLGLLESDTGAGTYLRSTGGVPATKALQDRFPSYYLVRDAAGRPLVPRNFVAASDPAFAPIRIHAFLLRARILGRDAAAIHARISVPPWSIRHPEARPSIRPGASVADRYLTEPFRWPFLGAAAREATDRRALRFHAAYQSSVVNQALRNLAIGRPDVALPFARWLWDTAPSEHHAALVAEALRAAGRPAEATPRAPALDRPSDVE